MHPLALLILGGTAEASALGRRLAGDQRFRSLLSFAGATKSPQPASIPVRCGGFGGVAGLVRFLRDERIDLLIDATHPFAVQMTRNASEASAIAPARLLRLCRPIWVELPGDRWHHVASIEQAASGLGAEPRRVLLTIGRSDLAVFRDTQPHHRYVVRSVDPPPPGSLPHAARVIAATGPFAFADELTLLADERIDVLVTKNAGGVLQPKIDAARALGIEVIMVDRPDEPVPAALALDVETAMAWLDQAWLDDLWRDHACLGA